MKRLRAGLNSTRFSLYFLFLTVLFPDNVDQGYKAKWYTVDCLCQPLRSRVQWHLHSASQSTKKFVIEVFLLWKPLIRMWMRWSLQCLAALTVTVNSCNRPWFNLSITWLSRICGAADKAVIIKVPKIDLTNIESQFKNSFFSQWY